MDVHFRLSGLEFTGDAASAVHLIGPGGEAVTITGNRFDGNSSSTGGAIYVNSTSSANETTVITGNTFSGDHAQFGGAVWVSSGQPLLVAHNVFTNDTSTDLADGGGGLAVWNFNSSSATSGVQVLDNVFGGTTPAAGDASRGAGGGAFVVLEPRQVLTLSGNVFQNDRITGANTANFQREGAGLFLGLNLGAGPYQVNQDHNLFLGNAIDETAASGFPNVIADGAGEWIAGLTVNSRADSFIGNRIAVNDGAPPEGGGVGAISTQAFSPAPAEPAAFNARNDLFIGNSTAAGGWGGAIYVGIPTPNCSGTCPASTVTLTDSTVVNNSVDPGAGSEGGAIWGSPIDRLAVSNSIIYGNNPKPEIFGFGSTTPAFLHSDVCNEAGGPKVSGAGLICANPALNANGTETSASPTLDAGSNTLVPAGLTTDLAGHARIAANRVTCAGPGPAIVDMGAFEATFKQVPSCNAKVLIARGKLTDKHGKAKLTLSCPHGYIYCHGTVTLTTVKRFSSNGAKHKGKRLKLGSAQFPKKHKK